MTDIRNKALKLHEEYKGKLSVEAKMAVKDLDDLSLVYSPGVAEPCKEIAKHPEKVYDYTMKGNLIAIISDGTAVLGLGNIGAKAAIPVMEGKALLFKLFAGIDAFPLCLDTTDIDRIVETVKLLQPTFGGINLEDIAAPNCFIIEERLKKEMDIPVFHDDQHGTAVVVIAGLINALKIVGKQLQQVKVVVNGAGAAGVAVVKLLLKFGVNDIIICDTKGAIYEGRSIGMNTVKEELALQTNRSKISGPLSEPVRGADVFIGLSMPNVLTTEMVSTMNADPIVFALANPDPEIIPEEAKRGGAKVVGTGRSDYPNQINNVLAFPGIFRGALDVQATQINEEMKIAAVYAIANLVNPEQLCSEYIIPEPFDTRVVPAVAAAVAKAALDSGVAKRSAATSYQENEHSALHS